ncbi:MAG: hypothetical protein ACRD4K_08935, partial [Candidatus Acidiferrales bacterium]
TDLKYGARHLKRSIERHLVYPLASLLATDQVATGDVLCVHWDSEEGELVFVKEAESTEIPLSRVGPRSAPMTAASGRGRSADAGTSATQASAGVPVTAAGLPTPAAPRETESKPTKH